jgi:hypothetical protein
MAQIARPTSDVSIGAWTGDGGETTNLWDFLNDNSDAEYIKSGANNTTAEFAIDSLEDPVSSGGHIIRFRMQGSGSGSPERCKVQLFEGAVEIADSGNQTSRGAWATKTYTLSTAQANSIGDYTDLRLKVTSSNLGGTEDMWVAWCELEVPDVPTFKREPTPSKNINQPSWKRGFAKHAGQCKAEFSSLWQGKIGHWCPALGATGDTLFDISGYKNNGAISGGATWIVVNGMHTLEFDGIDGQVDCGTIYDFKGSQPFSAFALVESLDTNENVIMGTDFDNGWELAFDATTETLQTRIDDGTLAANAWGTLTINNTGLMYSLGMTWDGDTLLGYVNGVQESSDIQAGIGDLTVENFYIATSTRAARVWGYIRLHDARVYNRALPPNEIRKLYNNPLGDLQLKPRIFRAPTGTVYADSTTDGVIFGEAKEDAPPTSRIINQKFEGAGYDNGESWTESVAGSNVVNEDANSSTVGSPSGWGSQCLFVDVVTIGSDGLTYLDVSALPVTYTRFEIVVTAESLTDPDFSIVYIADQTGVGVQYAVYIIKTAVGLRFGIFSYHDGDINSYIGLLNINLNQRYRVEVKWDSDNNKWAWRVDGVDQPNDQDASDPVTLEGNLTTSHSISLTRSIVGHSANNSDDIVSYYIDLVAVDDTDWVGAETDVNAVLLAAGNPTDGIKFGDSLSTILQAIGNMLDGAVFGDPTVGLGILISSLIDGIKAGDTTTEFLTRIGAVTDGIDLGDTTVESLIRVGNLTDGVKFGDSTINILTLLAVLTDGISLGDATVNIASLNLSVTDGADFGESVTNIATLISIITDGINLGDSTINIVTKLVSVLDGIKLGDIPSENIEVLSTIIDGIKTGDTTINIGDLVSSVSDGTKYNDLITKNLDRLGAITDGVDFGDTTANIITKLVSVVDGIKAGDTPTETLSRLGGVLDGVVLGDSSTNIATLLSSVTDGIKAGDTSATILTILSTIIDGILLGDSTINIITKLVSVIDGIKAGDSSNNILTLLEAVSDGIKAGDSTLNLADLLTSVSDGVDFGDSSVVIATLLLTLTDGIVLGDSTANIITKLANVVDGIKLGDTRTNIVDLVASLTDGVVFSDTSLSALAVILVSVLDGIKLGDTEADALSRVGEITDGIKLGDAALGEFEFSATLTDGIVTGDSVGTQVDFQVTLADGTVFTDASSVGSIFLHAVADGVAFSDAVITTEDATGKVTVTFTVKKTGTTFNVKKPSSTFTVKKPSATFTVK